MWRAMLMAIPGGRCKTCTDYYQCDLAGGCLKEFHKAARRQVDWEADINAKFEPHTPRTLRRRGRAVVSGRGECICDGSGLIERPATPQEVDEGCELGIAYDICQWCNAGEEHRDHMDTSKQKETKWT